MASSYIVLLFSSLHFFVAVAQNTGLREPANANCIHPAKDEIRLDLTASITARKVIRMIELSESQNFINGYSINLELRPEADLKAQYVVVFGEIVKKACPNEYVPVEFVNKATNFIMMYFNNSGSPGWTNDTQKYWRHQEVVYNRCKDDVMKITFFEEGDLVTMYKVDSNNHTLLGGNDITGYDKELDYIVETLWYMFLCFSGACYGKLPDKTGWLANMFVHFRTDFLEELQQIWKKPLFTNYGLIFGDIDLYTALYNLRACVWSVFQARGIEDRLFFRPLKKVKKL